VERRVFHNDFYLDPFQPHQRRLFFLGSEKVIRLASLGVDVNDDLHWELQDNDRMSLIIIAL